MKYIIYKHTTPNGKVYIGQTKQRLSRRWCAGGGYKGCPYFNSAIKKYGWDNITHEILCECGSKEEANAKEIEYIAEYKSNDENYGYNLTTGGQGSPNRVITDEYRQQISKKNKGKVMSEEAKEKLRKANIGKKHSKETKAKMSASRMGNKYRLGTKMSDEDKLKRSIAERGKGYLRRNRHYI